MKQETQCVHSGGYVDPHTRGVNTPIFTSSVYQYVDAGPAPYPRYFNTPNQGVVVEKMCALEGAEAGVLFSSGMAAISTTVFGLVRRGDHVVVQEEIYGGAHAMVTSRFEQAGIDYTFVRTDANAVADAVTDATRLIYVETPTNPLLSIVDLRRIAEIAKARGVLTAIDTTFASPVNQNPLELGIDIVLHSGTKYMGGHSDICCGIVLTRQVLADEIIKAARIFGGSLSPETCYLLERSLKTLTLRVERQTENAAKLADYLAKHSLTTQVYYPGLADHPGHAIAKSQMKGFGAMLSFELAETAVTSVDFMKRLQLIKPALSLGGVESTICSPALTSHSVISAAERARIGISDGLLRLSVGIEHSDDLIDDVDQALTTRN
jgi:cystathionine beta-lyase/cystathionine gamma-synthase